MASHASLTVADLKEIQAGPVVPIPTRNSGFLFFAIKNVAAFRKVFGTQVLPNITTSDEARNIRTTVAKYKLGGQMADVAGITVSFSQKGLTLLSLVDDLKDPGFQQGQLARAPSLGDDTKNWLPGFTQSPIHGLFEVTGSPEKHIKDVLRDKVKGPLRDTITVIFEHYGQVRPGKEKGHEHFGFSDGISLPYVQFEDDGTHTRKPLPGQTVVQPGAILLGKTGDDLQAQRPKWAINGSFLVYRHLQQLVPEFDEFLRQTVLGSIVNPLPPHGFTDSDDFQKRVNFLGARLVGRWKSGCPVVLTPRKPGEFPVDNPAIGGDPQRNNDFDYGPRSTTTPPKVREQFLCPFAAHTRKTGPRTDLPQGAIEKKVIFRGGIPFGPEVSDEEKKHHRTSKERGLSFVCFQSALGNGFEFIQQSWVNTPGFPPNTGTGVVPGFDPIISQKPGTARSMIGSDVDNLAKPLSIPKEFVVAQGGEYFFLPSMTTLRAIGGVV